MPDDTTTPRLRLVGRPLYLQVRDAVAERIARGEWKPGDAIPNEGDLAREFGVSAGTMRKALEVLEGARLVTRRQGRGTFVNTQARAELAARYSNIRGPDGQPIVDEVRTLDIGEGPATKAERSRLGLRLQDHVYRIRRVRVHDGRPFMVELAAIPAALLPDGPGKDDDIPGRIAELAQRLGLLPGKAEERVAMGEAGPETAEALGIEVGAPILVLDRVVLALDGRALEWRVGHCHLGDLHYTAQMV
jgi:GntR family transcriptional regulator